MGIIKANVALAEHGLRWCTGCGPVEKNAAALQRIGDGGLQRRDRLRKAIKPVDEFEERATKQGTRRRRSKCRACVSRHRNRHRAAQRRRDPQNFDEARRRWEAKSRLNPKTRAYRAKWLRDQREAAKTDPVLKAKLDKYRADYNARLRADPERYRAHLEHQRMDYRLAVERKTGKLPPPMETRTGPGHAVLPREPFNRWLDAAMPTLALPTREDVAAALGTSARRLRAVRSREAAFVSAAVVDRALLALGGSINVDFGPRGAPDLRPVARIGDLYPGEPLDVSPGYAGTQWPHAGEEDEGTWLYSPDPSDGRPDLTINGAPPRAGGSHAAGRERRRGPDRAPARVAAGVGGHP